MKGIRTGQLKPGCKHHIIDENKKSLCGHRVKYETFFDEWNGTECCVCLDIFIDGPHVNYLKPSGGAD